MSVMQHIDVIVVGAGAAGLSASRELSRAGASVTLLEAGLRPGGRILTERAGAWSHPIELGAEFVHGAEPELTAMTEQAELTLEPVPPCHFAVSRERIEPAKELEHVVALLASADELEEDCTALELLAASDADPSTARWFTHFVEGFHAGPIDRLSARSIAKQGVPLNMQFRVREGYGKLMEYLERDARENGAKLAYQTVVRDVRCHADGVEVLSDGESWRADAVIMAVPVSILRAKASQGGISFDPEPLPLRLALAKFEMGQALRIVIRLRELPKLLQQLPDGAFLHMPGQPLSTFWINGNRDEPQLTAWCGGPRAERWTQVTEPLAAAITSLSQVLGMSQSELGRLVLRAHVHDFGHDPHARGAYPYEVPLHGGARSEWLPGKPPLLFAGDYLDAESLGTVGAAVRSGLDAARTVLAHA
jgi:monoamine oxidase